MAAYPNAAGRGEPAADTPRGGARFVCEYDADHEPFPWAVRDTATGRLHRHPDPRCGVMRYPTQADADEHADRLNHADGATPDGAR